MTKVLRLIGILFAGIGAFFTGLGLGITSVSPALGLHFLVFTVLGFVFFCLGIGFLSYIKFHKRRRAQLLAEGTCIYAVITEVSMDTRFEFNGRHPLVIWCQAQNPEDGCVYIFRSEDIWYDPRPYLYDAGVEMLPVYVDPDNYKRYAVDTSGVLPELG